MSVARAPLKEGAYFVKFRLEVTLNVGFAYRVRFPKVLPTNVFFVVCLDGHRTDYAICRTCNSHCDLMIITVDIRQYRPMSDHLVANKTAQQNS